MSTVQKFVIHTVDEHLLLFAAYQTTLAHWLTSDFVTEVASVLQLYFQDWHILGALGEGLRVVTSALQQMQRVNINVQPAVEKAIAPHLVKAIGALLDSVLEHGLDADVEG